MADAIWILNNVSLGASRLRDVSLRIEPGITAILGCSGAGKSSLLNLLVGFERPDKGKISSRWQMNGHMLPVYWVPQDCGLWPHLSVRKHLLAVSGDNEAARVQSLLDTFEMSHRAEARPHELSQGERARVAVMRGLISGAATLVMDEPLASVDAARSGRFWRAVRDEARRAKMSLVYATHSPERVIGEADRVICMSEGAVLYDGPVEELYTDPPSREAAECLGEINWFSQDEAMLWLGETKERGVRPEHLALLAKPDAEIQIERTHARGAVAETTLQHKSGARKTVIHRVPLEPLKDAATVALKALLCLMIVLLASCAPSDDHPLKFSKVTARIMRPEGSVIPVPRALAVGKDDTIAVIDRRGRIQVFDKEWNLLREFFMPDTKDGAPEGMVYLPDGSLAVADTHYHRVVIFNPEGEVARMFGKEGKGPGEFIYPVGIELDDKNFLYVCEYGSNDRIQKFTLDGTFVTAFGAFGIGPSDLQRPSGMVWRDGKVYIADAINNRVQIFTDDGQFLGTLGGQNPPSLRFPYDIRRGPDNSLYIIEYGAGRLTQVGIDGRVIGRFGKTGVEIGQFQTPWGLEVDSRNRIFVADTSNARVVELDP